MLEKGDKLINVIIYCKNNNMLIYIKNFKNIFGIVINIWKKDKENYGIGFKSVKKIVNKYNGIIICEDKNIDYEVNIMMWNV